MKIKQQPEDFRVDEQTEATIDAAGPYAFYRLRKRGLGTPEAIQAICKEWRIEPRKVAHGGLKDRHALTTQHLTIVSGPRRNLEQSHYQLKYLGQRSRPFNTTDVTANRFHVVIRDLEQTEVEAAEATLEHVRRDGVPNYFDDQRFGSVGPSGRFIGRCLVDGNYEEALMLALAEPYEFDPPNVKREKNLLRGQWGKWGTLRARLPKGDAQRVAAYLADHARDFRGAVARLRDDLKSIYLAAYQSHLWNRLLATWIEEHWPAERLTAVELKLGPVPIWRGLTEEERERSRDATLPLPSARLKLDANDPMRPLFDRVMNEEGLALEDLKLKHFREPFFSKGDRTVALIAQELRGETGADELNEGKHKLSLRFDLPRGCYATMIVKRITAVV